MREQEYMMDQRIQTLENQVKKLEQLLVNISEAIDNTLAKQ